MSFNPIESTFLLVDDDPFQIKLLSAQLANLGVKKMESFTSGQAVLDKLEQLKNGNSIMLLDLDMPEMDGVELMRHLAKHDYFGALGLVSGQDAHTLQAAYKLAFAHRLNILGQLQKPVQSEALQMLLERWRVNASAGTIPERKTYGPEELRRAIARGELTNFYQPKVEVATGAMAGVETLVRWRHPEEGLVFPDQFIPVAEKHHLIDDLTRAVLSMALEQSKQWRACGLRVPVAVNVSMDNLADVKFPEYVLEELARNGLEVSDLVLEVTESRLMQDSRAPLDVLTRLRIKGIRLSIDDFGTGYSSLSQLLDFPFSGLKIDRAFVHGAADNNTLGSIFKASLGMARGLGIDVVAEGVEVLNDWNFLRKEGCDTAQGYFIAKPMPPENLTGWIADWEMRCVELAPR